MDAGEQREVKSGESQIAADGSMGTVRKNSPRRNFFGGSGFSKESVLADRTGGDRLTQNDDTHVCLSNLQAGHWDNLLCPPLKMEEAREFVAQPGRKDVDVI